MATYKISEILNCIQSMANDGFEYVDISETTHDNEDIPTSLCIEAIIDEHSSEEDFIDSVILPKDYFHLAE